MLHVLKLKIHIFDTPYNEITNIDDRVLKLTRIKVSLNINM